jgi:CxxC-x17-CxxC domain-containing protein
MRQALKNETETLELINKIQALLIMLDKKVDALLARSAVPPAPAAPKAPVNNNPTRTLYKAICADCNKECSIPFKPSGDRPVYCQDCFSRRKVIKLSGINVDEKPQIKVQEPQAKTKKAAAKKPVAKKKTVPKKK